MDPHDGEVSGCPIGANVQVDGYDLARLSDGVVYRNNDLSFAAQALPVPAEI